MTFLMEKKKARIMKLVNKTGNIPNLHVFFFFVVKKYINCKLF